MKITFILPAIGKEKNKKYISSWKMEPLTVAVLKSLTPSDIETEFFDDRIELINYSADTDLVVITVETTTAKRAYAISEQFRHRNKKVIMGGYHVTLIPEEASQYCDAVMIGNAEKCWLEIIKDYQANSLKKVYHGSVSFTDIIPDRSILTNKKYLPLTLVETGRGCVHNCEFCSVTSYYKQCYFSRPIKNIVKEIELAGNKFIYFVDDNIIADKSFAYTLFKEITPLKILWSSQASLNMAKDTRLLNLMKKSGCDLILIGFESLIEDNLRQMKKDWLLNLGDINTLIKNIHEAGISIYATFVFGFDYDTTDSFKMALDFCMKHRFYFAAFNHLMPFPGTAFYQRLKSENRLLDNQWWLSDKFRYGDVFFMPKNLTPEDLSSLCSKTRKEFFRLKKSLIRGINLISRKPSLPLLSIFLSQNLNLKKEVDLKYHLKFGDNLDELPK